MSNPKPRPTNPPLGDFDPVYAYAAIRLAQLALRREWSASARRVSDLLIDGCDHSRDMAERVALTLAVDIVRTRAGETRYTGEWQVSLERATDQLRDAPQGECHTDMARHIQRVQRTILHFALLASRQSMRDDVRCFVWRHFGAGRDIPENGGTSQC